MHIDHSHDPNGHPSLIDYIIGLFASIGLIIYKIITGFIDHNGGLSEIFYSLLSIAFFGIFGATVSYLWNRFVLKKKKP